MYVWITSWPQLKECAPDQLRDLITVSISVRLAWLCKPLQSHKHDPRQGF